MLRRLLGVPVTDADKVAMARDMAVWLSIEAGELSAEDAPSAPSKPRGRQQIDLLAGDHYLGALVAANGGSADGIVLGQQPVGVVP